MLCLFFTLVTCFPAMASDRFEIVTTEELKTLLAKRERHDVDFLLVNTLETLIGNYLTIPGSVNIPWSRVDELSDRLGSDKQKRIITYCLGYPVDFAYKTAVAIRKLGFTNVGIYNGGLKGWKKSEQFVEPSEPLAHFNLRQSNLNRYSAPKSMEPTTRPTMKFAGNEGTKSSM